MRAVLPLLLISHLCIAQAAVPGGIKVQGACNEVVAGSGNQVTLNCNGISHAKAAQLVRLLNTIISRQLDPDEVYAQLSQISRKVDSLSLAVSPLNGMSHQEQKIFLDAQQTFNDCQTASSAWLSAGQGDWLHSIQAETPARNALTAATINLQTSQAAYQQNPSSASARQAYIQAQSDLRAATTEFQAALRTAQSAPLPGSAAGSSVDQARIAFYRSKLEPQMVRLRAEMLAIAPDASPPFSPDYATVSSADELRVVCSDFFHLGLKAYNEESQRVRDEHAQPVQPSPR